MILRSMGAKWMQFAQVRMPDDLFQPAPTYLGLRRGNVKTPPVIACGFICKQPVIGNLQLLPEFLVARVRGSLPPSLHRWRSHPGINSLVRKPYRCRLKRITQ